MMRAIIVDDERKCRESLSSLLTKFFGNIEVVAMTDSVKSTISSISIHNPDLVFLDIEMPNSDGFELLEQLDDINFDIIFVTAHDKYAIKAFEYSAIGYLLKPVDPEKLKMALNKSENRINISIDRKRFDILLENLDNINSKENSKLSLPTMEGFQYVKVNEIVRCESSGHYTAFHLKDGSHILVSRILKEYEELLTALNFFRVHQSHLINLNYIKKYIRTDGTYVEMADKSKIPISKRKKISFSKRMEAF